MNIQTDHFRTGEPAFAVDQHGAIVLWNQAAEHALGYPSSEALEGNCWELLCGDDIYGNRYCFKSCPLLEMALQHKRVNTFHFSFEAASQEKKPFLVSFLTMYDKTGNELLLHICHTETTSPKDIGHQAPPKTQPENLSQRELEVLAFLAENVGTADIAARLSISIRTVRTHIQHILYKLRVHKRRDAIRAAKLLKLI